MLNAIGALLARDVDYPLNRTLLYAKAASNVVSTSIYKDAGGTVVYRRSDSALRDAVLEMWEEQTAAVPWVAMEYFVCDGRFTVAFTYPDDPDWSDDLERRERVVARYYGDKPVVYPPLQRGRPGLSFKL